MPSQECDRPACGLNGCCLRAVGDVTFRELASSPTIISTVSLFIRPLRHLREVIGMSRSTMCGRRFAASKSREWMSAQLFHPTGEQAHTIRFRRLVQIRREKQVIWRDE